LGKIFFKIPENLRGDFLTHTVHTTRFFSDHIMTLWPWSLFFWP